MQQQPTAEEQTFNIVVKGPNGEKVQLSISSLDTAISLKERLLSYYSFSIYSCYHFEVDAKPGRKSIDELNSFGTYDFIKEGSIFYLVCDQYNTLAARDHIKRTVALVSDNLPLLGLLLKKQDDDMPESLVDFQKLLETAEKEKESAASLKLKEHYFDEATVAKDQALKSEIEKPSFPVTFNLESFHATHDLLTEKKPLPVVSISMPAYNPPTAHRQLVGDLVYIRLVTKENEVYYVTGSSNGFFVNNSTDSVFSSSLHTTYTSVYPTLSHVLLAISPLFKTWYEQRIAEGDQVDHITLEDLISTLHPLPSSNVSAQAWFSTHKEDEHNLFNVEDIMNQTSLPYLSANVTAKKQWLGEYTAVRTLKEEEELKIYYMIDYENQFGEAATHAVMKIVDEAIEPLSNDTGKIMYEVDGLTCTRVASSLEGNGARAIVNYEILGANSINSAMIPDLCTTLIAVVDYKGARYLVQTPLPGINDRDIRSLLLYGSVDNGETVYYDKQIQESIKKLAEVNHWCSSSICMKKTTTEVPSTPLSAPTASKPVQVEGNAMDFIGPVDAKLLRGTDGHVYALDFIRTQPVDCYWIQQELQRDAKSAGQSQFILRPELIQQMVMQKTDLEQRQKEINALLEKQKKGEKLEGITEAQLKQLEDQLPLIEKALKELPTAFDVNCFTPYSASTAAAAADKSDSANTKHETDVIILSNFLATQILPILHEQLKSYDINNQDGSKIVQLMHSSGANIRYLGELASLCFNKTLKETDVNEMKILRACENEMIARACKQILNVLLNNEELAAAPAYTVAAFLNAVISKTKSTEVLLNGLRKKSTEKVPTAIARTLAENNVTSTGMWKLITSLLKSKFHYESKLWCDQVDKEFMPTDSDRVVLMRRICILMGIQLESKCYDLTTAYVISPKNIEGFAPHVKYTHTALFDDSLIQLFQQCSIYLAQGQLAVAFALCRQIVITSISSCHMLHPIAIKALSTMASILFTIKDYASAVKYNRLALKCIEKVHGVDSIEAAIAHSQLSDALGRAGGLHESILHYKSSLDIYYMACSDHSEEIGEIYANLGLLYKQLVFNNKAVACLRIALEKLTKSHPLYLRSVKELTQCYVLNEDWSNAVKYEQLYLDSVKETNLEEKEILITESSNRLKDYNKKLMLKLSMKSILG